MKTKVFALFITLSVLLTLFAGCANQNQAQAESSEESGSSEAVISEAPEAPSEPAPVQSEPEPEPEPQGDGGIMAQIDELYGQLSREKLPPAEWDPFLQADEASLAELPRQLVVDTPEAYYYAQVIRNYLAQGTKLPDFESPDHIYVAEALKVALYHTKPIKWIWDFQGGASGGVYNGPNDDNIVNALVKREVEEGRGICDVFYAEDVHATIQKLFGDEADIWDHDVFPYYYYDKEKVYTRIGDFGGPGWQYPVVTSMQATPDGMICDIILVWALDKDTPLEADGIELTPENFKNAAAKSAEYRYTFVNRDGGQVLASLKTLREGAE